MKLNKMTLIAALAVGSLLTLGTGANAQDATTNKPAVTPAPAHPPMHRTLTPNIELLAKRLNLSDEQKTNVVAAMQERTKKRMEVLHDTSITPAERGPKMKELTEAYNAKLKEILTPEQFTQYQKMMSGHRPAPAPAPVTPAATPPSAN